MATTKNSYRIAAEQAISDFQKQLELDPLNADLHNSTGNAFLALGKTGNAINCYINALAVKPDFAVAAINLATALHSQGEFTQAEHYLRHAVHLNPDDARLHYSLTGILSGLAKYDEALEYCSSTLRLQPGLVDAITAKADILERKGEYAYALEVLEPVLSADKFNIHALLVYARISQQLKDQATAIALLENAVPKVSSQHAIRVHAALGNLYDQTGRYDDAFKHFRQSNTLKHSDFDPDSHTKYIENILSAFAIENKGRIPESNSRQELPVFIIGMPRSGTTLVEQILSSHPEVFGAEATVAVDPGKGVLDTERPYPHYIDLLTSDALNIIADRLIGEMHRLAPWAVRVCCSERRSFLYLGLINLIFPKARIIHCTRNPVDTCLSCYFQSLAPAYSYSYNLEHLGKYYLQYRKIMNHWEHVWKIPMLEVRYEDMVTTQERVTRELLEYCGLKWDESCMAFNEQKRGVSTPSYWQVRQPIYNTSLDRWKNYQQYVQPLLTTLGNPACTSVDTS